jgi:hypothetical protein
VGNTREATLIESGFVEHWMGVLAELSDGLDLSFPADRVAFRLAVGRQTENMTVRGLRGLAFALGAARVGLSRGDAHRAVADAWIQGATR